ncbi:MAG: hypothetical protein NVS2B14_17860 [Chamaesiphon sp.]
MIEAMYGVEFQSNQLGINSGYGVAIFETDRIFGGDSSFVYIGKYKIQNGTLKVTVKVTNDRKIMSSVFGVDEFTLYGEGTLSRNEFTLEGYMQENPAMKIVAKFTRRAELP